MAQLVAGQHAGDVEVLGALAGGGLREHPVDQRSRGAHRPVRVRVPDRAAAGVQARPAPFRVAKRAATGEG